MRLHWKKIHLDRKFQIRAYRIDGDVNPKQVKEFVNSMRNGAEFPPIKVAEIGGVWTLVEGFHRYRAMEVLRGEMGREVPREFVELRVEVVEVRDEVEAVFLAVRSNLKSQWPLKSVCIRKAFRAYMEGGLWKREDGGVKSSREISKDLFGRVSHMMVLKWMEQDFNEIKEEFYVREGEGGNKEWKVEPKKVSQVDSARELLRSFRLTVEKEFDKNNVRLILDEMMQVRCIIEEHLNAIGTDYQKGSWGFGDW